jgi:hypothetical protein
MGRISSVVLVETKVFVQNMDGAPWIRRLTCDTDEPPSWARTPRLVDRAEVARRARKDYEVYPRGCHRVEGVRDARASRLGTTIWPDQTDLLALVKKASTPTKDVRHSTACAPEALGEKEDSMRARFSLSFAQKGATGARQIIERYMRSLSRVVYESRLSKG